MKWITLISVVALACVGCGRMPEKKDPLEEELVTPEEKEAIERFGDLMPEA